MRRIVGRKNQFDNLTIVLDYNIIVANGYWLYRPILLKYTIQNWFFQRTFFRCNKNGNKPHKDFTHFVRVYVELQQVCLESEKSNDTIHYTCSDNWNLNRCSPIVLVKWLKKIGVSWDVSKNTVHFPTIWVWINN